MPTVKTRTPWSAAIRAASVGFGPVVVWPSVSTMIAADVYDPGAALGATLAGAPAPALSSGTPRASSRGFDDRRSMSTSGKIIFSATRIPLPTAVPRCNWKRSMAARMSSRLRVGGCTTDAVAAKDTTPMRAEVGWSATTLSLVRLGPTIGSDPSG